MEFHLRNSFIHYCSFNILLGMMLRDINFKILWFHLGLPNEQVNQELCCSIHEDANVKGISQSVKRQGRRVIHFIVTKYTEVPYKFLEL